MGVKLPWQQATPADEPGDLHALMAQEHCGFGGMVAPADDDRRRDGRQPPPQIEVIAQRVQRHDAIEIAARHLVRQGQGRGSGGDQQAAILDGAPIGETHAMA